MLGRLAKVQQGGWAGCWLDCLGWLARLKCYSGLGRLCSQTCRVYQTLGKSLALRIRLHRALANRLAERPSCVFGKCGKKQCFLIFGFAFCPISKVEFRNWQIDWRNFDIWGGVGKIACQTQGSPLSIGRQPSQASSALPMTQPGLLDLPNRWGGSLVTWLAGPFTHEFVCQPHPSSYLLRLELP